MNGRERHWTIIIEGRARIERLRELIAKNNFPSASAQTGLLLLARLQEAQSLIERQFERRYPEVADAQFSPPPGRVARLVGSTSAEQATALIAHEVNQPLSGILVSASAALRWLERDTPDLDKVRAALTNVLIAGRHTGEVVATLRKLFNNRPLAKAKLDLNDLIMMTLDLLRPELSNHRISLNTRLARQLPPVDANRTQFQQVILNLLTNAIESMLSVPRRVLFITTDLAEHSSVRVSVKDTGVGLDPNNVDRIFQQGFTTKADHTGLGLGLCRSIIKAHNGRIWASALGEGSNFQFELPAAPERHPRSIERIRAT
jgi:signal transduction histidine kinase